MTLERDRLYLEHILTCIAMVRDYTQDGKAKFMTSALVQDAVLRRLQTMAESSQRLPEELKAEAQYVDWRSLAGFRNVLVHDYLDGIDLERVWNAVEKDLPGLERTVEELIAHDAGT